MIGNDGGLGISELSRELGTSKTTAFNILCTLEQLDYVEQDRERGKYFLTSKILELSSELEFELREVAKPRLRELCRQVDETINLVVRTGSKVLYIEKVESSQPIQINTKVGEKKDIYCTAVGKAILAYTDEVTKKFFLTTLIFTLTLIIQ